MNFLVKPICCKVIIRGVRQIYNVLPLTIDGEGHNIFVLGGVQLELVTRYNYTAQYWVLDVLDADSNPIINGLPMVPNVDILKPYPDVKALIGSLVLVEQNAGDYTSSSLLGANTQLLWFPLGTAIVLPT